MAITSTWPDAWASMGLGGRGMPATRSVRQHARRRARTAARPSRARRVAWRPLLAAATDILMVVVWAAMIPGFMWLGAAAGF